MMTVAELIFHPILDNILNLVVKDVIASKVLIRTEPSLN